MITRSLGIGKSLPPSKDRGSVIQVEGRIYTHKICNSVCHAYCCREFFLFLPPSLCPSVPPFLCLFLPSFFLLPSSFLFLSYSNRTFCILFTDTGSLPFGYSLQMLGIYFKTMATTRGIQKPLFLEGEWPLVRRALLHHHLLCRVRSVQQTVNPFFYNCLPFPPSF